MFRHRAQLKTWNFDRPHGRRAGCIIKIRKPMAVSLYQLDARILHFNRVITVGKKNHCIRKHGQQNVKIRKSLFQKITEYKFWVEYIFRFLTFCWPCISVYLSQYLTNFMYKICLTISFISCLYMYRAHVLETCRGMK